MSRPQEPAPATGALTTIALVARREFRARFLTKSNLISLAVMVVVIVAGVLVANYFVNQDDGSADYTVGVAAEVEDLGTQLEAEGAAAGSTIDVQVMTRDQAEPALAEDLDAFLAGDPARPEMLVEETADGQLLSLVSSAVRAHVLASAVAELGGDPDEVSQAVNSAAPQVEAISTDGPSGQFGPAYLIAMVTIALMLFALISTGSLIAMGVVEEKTSRVVEILLATIRPSHLLAGKILGIGLVGLTQVVLLGAAAAVPTALTGLLSGFEINLGVTMLLLVVWFLLGFAVYALLFGGFAALVSRQEEIGAVTTPLMLLMFVPFYVSMFLVTNNPDGIAVRVMSQIPFFSPFMMPVRGVFDAVAVWELLLAIVIALATIPVLVWLAARVYHRGVLHTGARMKLREALRS
ncbi:ABC transporter permease [Ruania zhangjianzhongii]|uniref:ABC transporter permease n=1 Tax=Ruania zhangjianzhongii TaxID=2603206 RepID=UPI0011CCB92B|nr:ABC transporter permease [Ruania zhangjianzhongii]